MKKVEIFTDGACSGNPGIGGWGVLLRFGQHEKELSGGQVNTTNNKMEMMAVIEGLSQLKEPCDVTIYTDSQYVLKGYTEWLPSWISKGWKTAGKKPVANVELWQQIVELSKKHHITWVWVKGHAGHKENERVDALARQFYENYSEK